MDNAAILDSISELGEDFLGSGDKVPVVTCNIEDVLTEADIAEYCEKAGDLSTAVKSDQKDLQVVRAKHHQVARLLATGMPEGVVAQMTGYTASSLSNLKNNPSMVELIAHYRAPGNMAAQELTHKLCLVANMSLDELVRKLENNEVDDVNQLLAAAKLGSDRSGAGPMQKVEHDHVHRLNEEQVTRLARTAREQDRSRIIPIDSVRRQLPAPRQDSDDSAA